jgi:hypothetical protein
MLDLSGIVMLSLVEKAKTMPHQVEEREPTNTGSPLARLG